MIVPTSTSSWSLLPQDCGTCAVGANGSSRIDGGAPGATTRNGGANTCSFDTAATEMASGAVPGEPAVPSPKSSRSFPAAITGTTPAAATLRTASTSGSVAGSDIVPPPEKLITSMPSCTAASNAATIWALLETRPTGEGVLKTR
jgi:hypothetical protein